MRRDRRRYSRAGVELDATVEAAGRLWEGKTLNLSPYGAKVNGAAKSVNLPPGTRVRLRLPLRDRDPLLSLPASVERTDSDGMALSFDRLAEQQFQLLKEFVDSLGAPRAPETARETPPGERSSSGYPPLLDLTPAMQAIEEIIERVADTNATVLIRGESGVGKELVARAIHDASPRRGQPFIKVNCAALPGELLESELLGHEKGAFTGAYRRKLGKFEFANKGTLFLDEIGELPLALQAKLLHVLQDHSFSRLGGRDLIQVDTRIIASTNRNLEIALAAGQFREDLYYRLNVVEIHVPPLRERKEEIPTLVSYFLDKFQRQYRRKVTLPADTLRCFTEYPWPGNVRELENVMRRLVVLGNVRQIQEEILTRLHTNRATQPQGPGTEEILAPASGGEPSMGLREIARLAAREAERRTIAEVLERVRWNRTQAARLLKTSYKTLLGRIAEYGLGSKQKRGCKS